MARDREVTPKAVLDQVEARIRDQAKLAAPGSMAWRAHMADLIHVGDVRREMVSMMDERIAEHEVETGDDRGD